MATSIKVNNKKIPFTVKSELTFADGTIGTAPATITAAVALKAYTEAYVSPPVIIPPVVVPPPVIPPVVTPPADVYISIGSGSGNLSIPDSTDKNYKIKPGVYSYISIPKALRVKIDGSGVSLSRNGVIELGTTTGLELFGFNLSDLSYRAIQINGFTNGFYLHDMTFRNVPDYVISYNYGGYWDGTDKTVSKGWNFDKLTFDNTGPCFVSVGELETQGVKNLMKDFTFSNSIIKNCPTLGNSVEVKAVDGYSIFGNTIENVNSRNNNDNAAFKMIGTGKCYNNIIKNHQGYLIRAWCLSFGPSKGKVELYGNHGFNSSKYSLLEVQATDWMRDYVKKYPNRCSFADAEIFGNAAARMNTTKDWAGVVAVFYNTYGSILFKENKGAELYGDNQDASRLYFSWTDPKLTQLTASGNVYYPSIAALSDKVPAMKSIIA